MAPHQGHAGMNDERPRARRGALFRLFAPMGKKRSAPGCHAATLPTGSAEVQVETDAQRGNAGDNP